jgi:hypothetical protein
MRWSGEGGRFILVPVVAGKKWMLALAPDRRGVPVKRLPDMTFSTLADAEWAVFKLRWEAITGRKIPQELTERP